MKSVNLKQHIILISIFQCINLFSINNRPLFAKHTVADTACINRYIQLSQQFRFDHIDSSLIYAKKAYNLSIKTGYKEAESAYILGVAYSMFNEFVKATQYFTASYQQAEKSGNSRLIYIVLNAIATNYAQLDEFEKALAYFKRCNELCPEEDNFNALLNIGQAYIFLKEFDEAELYLRQALEKGIKNALPEQIVSSLNVLGKLYYDKKDYNKSFEYYSRGFKLSDSVNQYQYIRSMGGIAQCYAKTGRTEEAIRINLTIDSLAGVLQFKEEQQAACYELSELYESKGAFKQALHYFKKFRELENEIYQKDKANQINFLNIEFETRQKEMQISSLQKMAGLRKMLNFVFIISGCLITLVLCVLLKNKQQKNKILALEREQLKQDELRAQLEKQRLIIELHEKNRELLAHVLQINQQKEALTEVHAEISKICSNNNIPDGHDSINKLSIELQKKIDVCDDWKQVKLHFEKVHPGFFTSLKDLCPGLTLYELKLLAYTKLKFDIKEISRLLNINPASVHIARSRLKKKLNLPKETNLDDFIDTL